MSRVSFHQTQLLFSLSIPVMLLNSLSVAVLYAAAVSGSALTFLLKPEEKSCFYILTEKPKTQVGYYFAVQSGGAFDIDYTITNPQGKVVASESKQRQGDWVFNADVVGEYEFCFSNEMSTFAEKFVDFEINLDNDFKADLPEIKNSGAKLVSSSLSTIESKLNSLLKKLQYYKTRNNRNQSTVRSTESRIFYFSLYEVLLVVGMAVFQISVVQYFFKGSRRQLV